MAVAVAEFPKKWLAAIRAFNTPDGAADVLPPKIPKGKQHYTLVSFAGTMRKRGAEFPVIFAALKEMNAVQCAEPGTEAEIRKIAEGIGKKPAGQANWTYLNGFATEGSIPPPGHEGAPPHAAKRPQIKLPQSTDGLAIFKAEFPDHVAVIGDLLYSGVTLFAGHPKVGKSWLTLLIALAVATGKTLFDRFNVERDPDVLSMSPSKSRKSEPTPGCGS